MNVLEMLFKLIQKKYLDKEKHILNLNIVKSENEVEDSFFLHNAASAEVCKELITNDVIINTTDSEGRTPLHLAILHRRGIEAIRELLKSGACVNVCDSYKCTPLILAIQLLGKDRLETVIELLKYGANPNIHDHQGYSVLTLAIYKGDLNLIRELLEWGADINFRNKVPVHSFLMFLTPMTEAVNCDEECAKILIKMTVMKYFDNDYKKIINLNCFSKVKNFIKLSNFLEECACEVHRMKSLIINKKHTLFDFVVNSRKCFKPLYWDDYTFGKISSAYPIYQDVILTNIQPHLLRAQLLSKLRGLRLHAVNKKSGKEIFLNTDCYCKMAEYLSNDELSELIKAYDNN